MAKKDVKIEEVKVEEVVVDTKATKDEVKETPKVEELKVVEPLVLDRKDQTVKVIPMQDIDNIYIGKTYYDFRKNVEVAVPVNVKRILKERDLIK